jgi:hypothetical protein
MLPTTETDAADAPDMKTQVEPEEVIDPEISADLKTIINRHCDPDQFVRERMVAKWKRLENYWDGKQFQFYDYVARDYRDATNYYTNSTDPEAETDPLINAKHINIYRAHGEAWVAALSAGLPFVRFFPDDADNPDDNTTAKAYSKISELIQKHNSAEVLFMRALFLLFNTGLAFAYNENRKSSEYGTFSKQETGQFSQTTNSTVCPECGYQMGAETLPPQQIGAGVPSPEPNPGQPPVPPSPESGLPPQGGVDGPVAPEQMAPPPPPPPMPGVPQMCEACGMEVIPEQESNDEVFEAIVGETSYPKSREVIRIFGPLQVQVPHWVTRLEDSPYLRLDTEEAVSRIQEIYPEFAEKIIGSMDSELRNRWGRTNKDYAGDPQTDVCTLSRVWLRPWAYNILGVAGSLDHIEELKSLYPDGVYVVIVNDTLVLEVVEDKLDDHWTATTHPFSEYLHAEPQGANLVPVQDMTNELANLTLETIEFGIPETFADPGVLDFNTYKKSQARPGMVYPAKAMQGQGLSAGFHDIKASTLSQEVELFAARLETAAQFVLGTFPSIYGGALDGGSGTAREYEISRQQALQRLSTSWTMVKSWWAKVMAKSVVSFANNMQSDEKHVKAQGNSFVNVWIRQAEMNGKVGAIEPETNEGFPISWSQKRDVVMNLIGMKDEFIGGVLSHPENASGMADLIGLSDIYIPGDDDRNKQLHEISTLLMGQPTPTMLDPMTGQPVMTSTIPIDPELDTHELELATCMSWLKSEVGLDAKVTNPGGYANVRAHAMEHMKIVQQQAAMQAQAEAEAAGGEEGGGDGEQKPSGPPQ